MLIYFCIIGLIFIDFGLKYLLKKSNVLCDDGQNKGFWHKFLDFVFKYRVITICALVTFSTIKSLSVGADSLEYFKYYQLLRNNECKLFVAPLGAKFEFGYTFIVSIFAWMNLPFRALLLATSLFVSIIVVLFVNKISTNKLMSIILYVALGTFAQSLNLYRQIIAIAFVMLAIMMLIDKKWLKASVFIIVATTFHVSAIISLIIVPIRFIKPKWWLVVGGFSLAVVGAFAFPAILKLIEKLTFLDYYSKYFVNDTQYLNSGGLLDNLYTIALVVVFSVIYVARFKLLKLEEKDKIIYDFFLLIFIFVPLFRVIGAIAGIPQLLNRVTIYFFVALMILVPLFVKGFKHNTKLYIAVSTSIYIIAFGFMYYLYAVKLSCEVVPYIFCF